jgi:hypothetical protein
MIELEYTVVYSRSRELPTKRPMAIHHLNISESSLSITHQRRRRRLQGGGCKVMTSDALG